MPATGNLRGNSDGQSSWRSKLEKNGCMRHVAAKTSKRIQKSSFSVGKRIHIRVILCLSLFCLLVLVCFFGCSSNKMGYGLVKPRVVRSCVVYVRKTSNFGPCIRNLIGQSIRGASSKKMAYETCSSQNVQAHPEV